MGPFMVVLMGLSQVAVPEAVGVLGRAPERLGRFCLVLGTLLAAAALLWGLSVLVLLPESWGVALIGELWLPAEALLPLVMTGIADGRLRGRRRRPGSARWEPRRAA